jgi:putative Mg2+ transporter-C (MgtC) family protein
MAAEIHWQTIAFRLVLSVVAGSLLGSERSKTGHTAGLRTTLLVTLAAAISMIQTNLLIQMNGKPHDSYVVMDPMRLPLGILTGVGFIGAGVIIRKDEMVIGITTAATMWFATVVGLCLGGGQVILGSVSTAIGFVVLWGFRRVEQKIESRHIGELKVTIAENHLSAQELRGRLEAAKFHIKALCFTHSLSEHRNKFDCEVRWPSSRNADIPDLLTELEQLPGLIELEWKSIGTGPSE